MARAVWAAVEVTLFSRAAELLATRRARDVADAWRQRGEDGIEMFDDVLLAANHHAVSALKSPDAAAGAHVDVMDTLRREFLRAPNVVDVIRIAAVDEDVACLQMGQQIGDRLSTTAAGTINQMALGF